MSANDNTIWERKPHTAAKHAILQRYLGAWFPKLAWRGRVIVVDGFAGPGVYSKGEPGSPLVALTTAVEHKRNLADCELLFLFIEQDKSRYDHLNALIRERELPSYVKWEAVHGTFADVVGDILNTVEGKRMAPAFFMIDPFGFSGMPFSVIERIASHGGSEALISFMYESVVRWRNHPDHAATFDSLFGTSEWRSADSLDAEGRKQFLLQLYASRLATAGMKYVRSFEMRDEGNRTEYFLIYGTHHIEGLKAMKDAMWKADPGGGMQFSDFTISDQMTLFSPEPAFEQLRALIKLKFANTEAPIEDIEEYVVVETSFRETHFKKQILSPMEKGGEIEITRSPRKKRFTYPAGTVIKFL